MSTSLDRLEDISDEKPRSQFNFRISQAEARMLRDLAGKNGMDVTNYILWCCGVRRKRKC